MGEPAGIGGDLTLRAFARSRALGLAPFFAVDDPARLDGLARRLGLAVAIEEIHGPEDAARVFPRALPVMAEPLNVPAAPGQIDPRNAEPTIASIRHAVRLALDGRAAAVVTNPIQKRVLYDAGFDYPGHTEFLGALCGGPDTAMMLCAGDLRVVPVTVHRALRDAIGQLTIRRIVAAGKTTDHALRADFGLPAPRLAVAALNPHAGEQGRLGIEEISIIGPAIDELRSAGIDAFGPEPADTLFHADARTRYDAVLCMYHDQALIPLKTIDFWSGVNVTLGLPIVRTSPDHGTALSLAGTGRARPDSFIAALGLAAFVAGRRRAAVSSGPAGQA